MLQEQTKRWYTMAEVAEMLGFGLSKVKTLVITRELRSSQARPLPAHPTRVVDEFVDQVCRESWP